MNYFNIPDQLSPVGTLTCGDVFVAQDTYMLGDENAYQLCECVAMDDNAIRFADYTWDDCCFVTEGWQEREFITSRIVAVISYAEFRCMSDEQFQEWSARFAVSAAGNGTQCQSCW